MWPRHTGDWSYFRAYVPLDGKPADYNERNVLYEPEHALRLAEDSLQAGDYIMAIGYPGSTSRYLDTAERLYRLSIEHEKPDAEREPGYQERDLSRIKASWLALSAALCLRLTKPSGITSS